MPSLHEEIRALERRLLSGEAVVAGVLSGTSADGIDVGLLRFDWDPGRGRSRRHELLAFETLAFPRALHERVRRMIESGQGSPRECALLDRDLGRAFGAAARELARERALPLDLLGSHGQTVWHHDGDGADGGASLQLGDGDFVAEAAGCAVVSDFRQRDLAAGGEGAPITAMVDDELFGACARPLAILNLGGIANLSLLAEGRAPVAFDVGPAGCLLDMLARRWLGAPLDRGGEAARRGRPLPRLVAALLEDPHFERPAPKSTGRDHFGQAWLDRRLAAAGLAPGSSPARGVEAPDLLASAVAAIARSVARELSRESSPAGEPPRECLVGGGGVHNAALMQALSEALGCPVRSMREVGLDPDAREAIAFAALAVRFVTGVGGESERVTGALAGRLLGKFSPAPPADRDCASPSDG